VAATGKLEVFERKARARRSEDTLNEFPTIAPDDYRGDRWGAAAAQVYRNWLAYVASHTRVEAVVS
jgi:hypothetical protein